MDTVIANLKVQETVVVTIGVGAKGERGERGLPGEGSTDLRIHAIGEIMSNSTTGVTVAVTGMTSATDYVVKLDYAGSPLGSGIPWYERSVNSFIIKHYGGASIPISYVVMRKVAP